MIAILTALIGIASSVIVAYVTTNLKLRSEKAKWERKFALKYIEAKSKGEDYLLSFSMQYATAYISIKDSFTTSPHKHFLAPKCRQLIGRSGECDIIINDEYNEKLKGIYKKGNKDLSERYNLNLKQYGYYYE